MILVKIAFRNLREHARKTLLIGVLMGLGTAILVLGNSVTATITQGLEASFVENYTGDLILRDARTEEAAFTTPMADPPAVLRDYVSVEAELAALDGIEAFTPVLFSQAAIDVGTGTPSLAMLWGIEPSSYFMVFPDRYVLREGELLRDGQEGILLSRAIADAVRDEHGVELHVGDTVLLSGQNDVTGTKVREVTVRGIGAVENAFGGLEQISFVDANTLRGLEGLVAIRSDPAASEPAPATAMSEDALFGGGRVLVGSAPAATGDGTPGASSDGPPDYDRLLGDTSRRAEALALDNHAWHAVLVNAAEGVAPSVLAEQLEASDLTGHGVVVEDWRWGAGFIADLAVGVQTILNAVIVIIAIVALIIITNTLIISVTERAGEIGTVRAIGGQKSFIRSMITLEVLMIAVGFGALGVAVGGLAVGVLNVVGLEATNLFLQVLFGGTALHPVLSPGSLVAAVIAVAVIGIGASLYPASVALRVSPARAMQRN
jgi:putative ABC transport system permease protein